jgi:hypothetical protein
MKLPINPDSETVRSAANHLCRTLFQLTLQLHLVPGFCFDLPSRNDRRVRSKVKRESGEKGII